MSFDVVNNPTKPTVPFLVDDLAEHRTDEQLISDWSHTIDSSTNLAARDSLLEAMVRRGVRPDIWIKERDTESGLYPDIEDPDFASRLYRKTEFASLASSAVGEDTCSKSRSTFETTAVQRLLARFLHPSTPYRGLLVDHGVGVGKTCSAITVAETFLEIMPGNTVYIIAPQAIADGFKRTIFDVNRLVPADRADTELTGEVWKSPQCTGMTYLHLSDTAGNTNRDEVVKEVEKRIRKRYKILGYLAFANWVEGKLNAIPAVIQGLEREDKKKEILMNLFSDHLIIIDEAHNLRDVEADTAISGVEEADEADTSKHADAAEGKRLTPILRDIVSIAEGLRLMLMTATPMYNSAPEIIFLLNLLTLNDTKDLSSQYTIRDVFQSDGRFTKDGEAKLTKLIRRYVSYMRGENPNTFPLRLSPPDHGGSAFMETYPKKSISRKEGDVQLTPLDKKIMAELPLMVHTVGEDTVVGENLGKTLRGYATGSEITDFILDKTMQMGNITYPDGSFGTSGWGAHMKSEETSLGGQKITQYNWTSKTATLESVFGAAGLKSHAPKIAAILESVESSVGISFIYSRYVLAGALPMAIALELAGWCRVLADGTPAPLLNRTPKASYKNYYILLTANTSLSPNFKGLLEYATTFPDARAAAGGRVKAILGSQVASEGLDLKCIREIHLLDGWYHLNRIEQIEGRGIRFCSHEALPLAQRNCTIYLHVVNVPEYETGDLYAYRLAVRKAQPIGRVTRLMKINAWDCMLNIDAILLKELPKRAIVDAQGRSLEESLQDKPFSSFCDFMERCEYACGSSPVPPAEIGKDASTYSTTDFRRTFLERQERLATLFYDEDVAIPLSLIKETVYKGIPWSIAVIGLRDILGSLKVRRHDGLTGTLIYLNGYIVFQPNRVTDTQIPLALRYGRAFGKLPRTIEPHRTLFQAAVAPISSVAEVSATAENPTRAGDPKESAMRSLSAWSTLIEQITAQPSGKIPAPEGFPQEGFNGWRWVFHRFGTLKETLSIACRWWMDNIWTVSERNAMLHEWTLHGGQPLYTDTFTPVELFQGSGKGAVKGYMLMDGELKTHCMMGEDIAPCSDLLKPYVNTAIGKAVDRASTEEMGPVYGFLVFKKGDVVFKSVDMEKGKLSGAECTNTTNLSNYRTLIQKLQTHIRSFYPADDPLVMRLLNDDDGTKPTDDVSKERKDAVKKRYDPSVKAKHPDMDLEHIDDLSRLQICPYMEFLLRILDTKKANGKRWFLSLVDTARSEELTKGKKK